MIQPKLRETATPAKPPTAEKTKRALLVCMPRWRAKNSAVTFRVSLGTLEKRG